MNRRNSPATLAAVLDDHLHWLGRWQCSLMFPDKVSETNPAAPDTMNRWLASPDQRILLEQPAVRRLQTIHDELHNQAYQLGSKSPRQRPPFEEYDALLRNFDVFVGQVRRVERLVESAAKGGGIAALNADKTMELMLRELAEIMARAEAKGLVSSIAIACIDHYDELLKSLGENAADYIATEVVGRVGHNLRPFDDVFRLEKAFSVWYLQNAKLEDAAKAADRVRRKINILPVEFPDGRAENVTISVSLVGVDYSAPPMDLINAALDALRISQANAADQIITAA